MKEIINVTSATTQIKETIVKYITLGLSKESLDDEIKTIIAKCINTIESISEKENVINSLWQASRKWIFELSQVQQIINMNLVNRLKNVGLLDKTYTYDPLSSGNVFLKMRPLLEANKDVTIPIIESYKKLMKSTLKTMSADPPKIVRYINRSGKQISYPMSLRNRVEMRIRYDANLKDIQNLKERDVKLVWTSSHPNCSERCKDYQGRLWSLDGTSGTINGNRYEPLETAMLGKMKDGNGIISGYNCRHRLVEYQENSKPPTDYTEAEIKKEYAIDQRQRFYENTIRQLKVEERMNRAGGNIENAQELRKRWRRLNKLYEIYSLKQGRAYYKWRTVVYDEEE
jgi:hypothetical protein